MCRPVYGLVCGPVCGLVCGSVCGLLCGLLCGPVCRLVCRPVCRLVYRLVDFLFCCYSVHSLFSRLLKGKLGKRSGYLLTTWSSFLLL